MRNEEVQQTILSNSTYDFIHFLKKKKTITGKVSKTIAYGCEHLIPTQKSKYTQRKITQVFKRCR